jgi:UDP-N-acetylmuramoylalanine--D-glutamate ligase
MSIGNRRTVVLGLGLTGLSAARYLARHGASVRVADTRAQPPFAGELAAELPDVVLVRGAFADATFADADLIVSSPGVSVHQLAIAAAVSGGELVGAIEPRARPTR